MNLNQQTVKFNATVVIKLKIELNQRPVLFTLPFTLWREEHSPTFQQALEMRLSSKASNE